MLHLLLQYACPLMIPLSLVEGPIVAMAGGAGAATGQIDSLIAYAIVMGPAGRRSGSYWLGPMASSARRPIG